MQYLVNYCLCVYKTVYFFCFISPGKQLKNARFNGKHWSFEIQSSSSPDINFIVKSAKSYEIFKLKRSTGGSIVVEFRHSRRLIYFIYYSQLLRTPMTTVYHNQIPGVPNLCFCRLLYHLRTMTVSRAGDLNKRKKLKKKLNYEQLLFVHNMCTCRVQRVEPVLILCTNQLKNVYKVNRSYRE